MLTPIKLSLNFIPTSSDCSLHCVLLVLVTLTRVGSFLVIPQFHLHMAVSLLEAQDLILLIF